MPDLLDSGVTHRGDTVVTLLEVPVTRVVIINLDGGTRYEQVSNCFQFVSGKPAAGLGVDCAGKDAPVPFVGPAGLVGPAEFVSVVAAEQAEKLVRVVTE